MAKLGIFTGTSPNDTTGDTLSQGAVKINSNFSEIYTALGDGTNITNSLASITVAGLSTFTSGPVLVGSGIQTGTSKLQVNGNTFITGSVGIGTTNPQSQLHITGQFQTTRANNTATGGGQIYLNGSGGNRIDFGGGGVGVAAPTLTTRSVGTKIVLYPTLSVSNVDYALGIDDGIFWSSIETSSSQFKWYAGTTPIATLTGAGNLGIGTTNPLTKLDVRGVITAGSNDSTKGTEILRGYYTNGALSVIGSEYSSGGLVLGYAVKPSTTTPGQFYSSTGTAIDRSAYVVASSGGIAPHRWYIGANQTVAENSSVTISEVMRINGSGNLGIGTTNPTESLHVVGNLKVTGTITGEVSSTVATARTSTNVIGGIGSITQLQVTGISTFTNGPVLVGRATTTGTANQALQVESGAYFNGSVGIGTTNPSSKLHIVGDAQVDGNIRVGISTTSNYIAFRGTFGDGVNNFGEDQNSISKKYTTTFIGERIYDYSGYYGEKSELLLFKGNDSNFSVGPDRIRLAAAEFRFDTIGIGTVGTFEEVATSANITNKMILTGDGNLGIGTTNPTSSLSVNGSTVIGTEILNMTGLSSTFTTVGNNTFTVPTGVTKISAVLIGGGGAGGGGGGAGGGQGGGGGGLRYVNDFAVTAGQVFSVIVGTGGAGGSGNGGNGGDSQIVGIATAYGGRGGSTYSATVIGIGGTGTTISTTIGGGTGGSGGKSTLTYGSGGGGTAGYVGAGGTGGGDGAFDGAAGSGGGAGGGSRGDIDSSTFGANGGGGTGILGQGSSGVSAANVGGNAGSGGSNGTTASTSSGAAGGLYGGGGGGGDGTTSGTNSGGNGAQGVVRIIWSPSSKFSRLFPTNQVGNNINQ